MTQKTQVTQIQPGDVIDFDAHTGVRSSYEDSYRNADGSYRPFGEWERPTGTQRVTRVERVEAKVLSGTSRNRASEIEITFEDGRSIRSRGTAKLPVVA